MNRDAFFAAVRSAPFGGSLKQSQVDGMDAILDGWEVTGATDLRWLAYCLGTTFHETARAMQPVIETRQPSEEKNPSVDTAIARLESSWKAGKLPWVKTPYWRKDAAGLSWLGRGFVQCTHKSNYERAERETGITFSKNPNQMLEMTPAVDVLFRGMIGGWFTTKKLSDYFDSDSEDWKNARRIINGNESDEKVANYAKAFYVALLAAEKTVSAPEPPLVTDLPDQPSLEAQVAALHSMLEAILKQLPPAGLEERVKALEDASASCNLGDLTLQNINPFKEDAS